MLNKIVENQIEKLKIARLSITDKKNHFIIHKEVRVSSDCLQINHYYVIYLADYIIHEPPGFTLSINWNSGKKPTTNYYRCIVTNKVGTMFKISGVGFDINTNTDLSDKFEGWIPGNGISVLGELK